MKHTEESEVTFTDEQEAQIQARILQDREREHHAIAGDRAYRLAMMACVQSVNAGMDDEEIVRVMKGEWDRFKAENPLLGKKSEQKKPAPE